MYDLFGGHGVTAVFGDGSGVFIKHLDGVGVNFSLDAISICDISFKELSISIIIGKSLHHELDSVAYINLLVELGSYTMKYFNRNLSVNTCMMQSMRYAWARGSCQAESWSIIWVGVTLKALHTKSEKI